MLDKLRNELKKAANKEKAAVLSRFFKTGVGQYGHGDKFYGITVPRNREISSKYDLSLDEIQELLKSDIHEERLSSLIILVRKFNKADENTRKRIVDFYLKNASRINNWDLVDSSADKILGVWLLDKDKTILYKLAKSSNLWEKRIAMISTLEFIREKKFEDTIKISEILLKDPHDLIRKAVGWMLREMGKREELQLIKFLDKHHKIMPRTALRYSIERLSYEKKVTYMSR